MPLVTNLQAQTLGGVGIDNDNKTAALKILDDDNLKSTTNPGTSDSKTRRTIVVEKKSLVGGYDGVEPTTVGGSDGSPVKFVVRFTQKDAITPVKSTTAVQDVWVVFDIVAGAAPSATVSGTGADIGVPSTPTATDLVKVAGFDNRYRVKIPAGSNASPEITIPVLGDKVVDIDELFNIQLIQEGTGTLAGAHIPSDIDAETDFPVTAAPYPFKLKDKTGDSGANKIVTLEVDKNNINRTASPATRDKVVITATLPTGITFDYDLEVTLDLPVALAADYSLSQPKITIVKNTSSGSIELVANCTGTATSHSNDVDLVIKGKTVTAIGATITGFTFVDPVSAVKILKTGIGSKISSAGDLGGSSNSTCFNTSLVLDAPNKGTAGYKFNWYENNVLVKANDTEGVYEVAAGKAADNTYKYKVEVTSGNGCSRTSDEYSVTVNPIPVKMRISSPAESGACGASQITIKMDANANAVPTPIKYTWYAKEKGKPDSDKVVIATNVWQANHTGVVGKTHEYWVVAKHDKGGCEVISNIIEVTFSSGDAPAKPKIEPTTHDLCGGGTTLTASSTGAEYPASGVTYIWYKDLIYGDGAEYYTSETSNSIHPTTSGIYEVFVIVGGCVSVYSDPATVTGTPTSLITAPIIKYNNTVVSLVETCVDAENLTITNPGANYTIKWYKGKPSEPGSGTEITSAEGKVTLPAAAVDVDITGSATSGVRYYATFTDKVTGCVSVISSEVVVKKKVNAITVAKPVVLPNPANSTCGNGITLKVDNLSDYALNQKFQWYNTSGPISGAIGNSLFVDKIGNGTYYVAAVVENATCGSAGLSAPSDNVIVNITGTATLANPKITSKFDPASPELCNGTGAMVKLTAESTGAAYGNNVEYLWYFGKNSTTMNYLTTTTTNTYSAKEIGFYTVVVKRTATPGCVGEEAKSAAKEVISSGSTISFAAPTIAKKASTGSCAGGSAMLYVTNVNTTATINDYQWYKDGVKVEKAGEPLYGKGTSLAASENGSYTVVLTLSGCSAESGAESVNLSGTGNVPARPNVQPDGTIPGSLEFCDGGSSSVGNFKLIIENADDYATAGLDVEYMWYHTVLGEVLDAQGNAYNKATLFLPMEGYNSTRYAEGTYYAVVKDKNSTCLSESSEYREVKKSTTNTTDLKNPKIESNKVGNSFCDGGSVTLRVTNTSDYAGKDVTYTWYRDEDPSTPLNTVSSSQHFATVGGNYYVEVKEVDCKAYSNMLNVKSNGTTIDPLLKKPVITGRPTDGTSSNICLDNPAGSKGSVELTAKPNGGGDWPSNTTFEWYLEVKGVSHPLPASYGNGSVILTSEPGFYTVVAKGGACQSEGSERYQVTKGASGNTAPVAAEIKPEEYKLPVGGTVIITAKPISGGTFAPSMTFEWYRLAELPDDAPLMPGTPIVPHEKTNVAEYPVTVPGRYIVVVVDGDCRSEHSNVATVDQGTSIAPEKPWIKIVNSTSNVICTGNGGSKTLKAVPDSDRSGTFPENFTFVWYYDNGTTKTPIPGATSVTYHATQGGDYYVVARNIDGDLSPESDARTLVEDPLSGAPNTPDIAASSSTICENGSVVLLAKRMGGAYPMNDNIIFKWYRDNNGVEVELDNTGNPKVNSFVYDWQTGDPATIKFYVKVVDVVSGCESGISPKVSVTVQGQTVPQKPVLTTYNNRPSKICEKGTITLIVSEVYGDEYHWYKQGEVDPIKEGKDRFLTVDSEGTYYVMVASKDGANTCFSQASNTVKVDPSGNTISPSAPTINADNTKLCAGGVVRATVTGAPSVVAGYRWYVAYANGDYEIIETTTPFVELTKVDKGDIRVSVSYFDSNECVSKQSAELAVTVDKNTSAPSVTIESNGMDDFCAGLEVELKVLPSGSNRYVWFLNDVQLATTTNIHKAQAAGTYKVYVYDGTAPNACVGMAAKTLNDGGGNCIATYVELIVGAEELQEGASTTVTARLKNNMVAINPIVIDLNSDANDKAFRSTTGVCPLPATNGGLSDYTLPAQITIPGGARDAQVTLATCLDNVYEGDEDLTINATLAIGGSAVSGSGKKVNINDNQANPDGTLNLKWEIVTPVVYKGSKAEFKLIAIDANNQEIKVQRDEKVGLSYLPGSTAVSGEHYTMVEWATIPAGSSFGIVEIQTIDDKVAELDRVLLSDIETIHHKLNPAQEVLIRSNGVNPNGGFDFNVSLTPAEVVEGSGNTFKLTVSLDSTDPAVVLGTSHSFSLSQLGTSIAQLGVDYSMPSEVVVAARTNKTEINIDVIDNELFDGNRRMDIDVDPKDNTNRIMTKTPNPLSGLIKDNDKLCITITGTVDGIEDGSLVGEYFKKQGKIGIDEIYTTARVTVKANNLAATAGAVVIKLRNLDPNATHFQLVPDFSDPTKFVNLSSGTPSYTFPITTSLVGSSACERKSFEVAKYVPIHETIVVGINFTHSNIAEDKVECYKPFEIVNSDDFDQDRIPNCVERKDNTCSEDTGDFNNNGIPNEWDAYDASADDDGDGIANWIEDADRDGNPYNDFAGSSCLPNFANLDSDGDGVEDKVERWTNRPYDNNKEDIRIHPALSLNEDGIGNDFLYIENIEKYKDNKVTIFDRQGVVVFERSGYVNKVTGDPNKDPFKGIANKAKSGKKVPMGTYFVVVEYSGKYYDKAVEVRY